MVKLIIQIPCLNEEATLGATLDDLPHAITGIDVIETLIIDDGCTDATVEVARAHGVEHIIRFSANRGLGHAFAAGIDYCLRVGADIIVNTDGDNQYCGADIAKLVAPIIERRAELVIGDRQPHTIAHFSPTKKMLQRLGSAVISGLADLDVPDVASGFKAYSREAAARLVVSTDFDHTVDHVIQAGRKRIPTVSVPISTNEKLRESRLFSNVGEFIARSLGIAIRVYSSYGAMRMFASAGLTSIAIGIALGLRFLYFYFFSGTSDLHVQSLILSAILMLAGIQMILTGVVADLISTNRSVLEDLSYRLRRMESNAEETRADPGDGAD